MSDPQDTLISVIGISYSLHSIATDVATGEAEDTPENQQALWEYVSGLGELMPDIRELAKLGELLDADHRLDLAVRSMAALRAVIEDDE